MAETETSVGEWLASGYTNDEIIAELVSLEHSEEEAVKLLRSVYEHWQNTQDNLDLKETDMVSWHIFMRKKLLQRALDEGTIVALRLALSTLDSLAQIQGMSVAAQAVTVPLSIVLNAKEEKKDEISETEQSEQSEQAI